MIHYIFISITLLLIAVFVVAIFIANHLAKIREALMGISSAITGDASQNSSGVVKVKPVPPKGLEINFIVSDPNDFAKQLLDLLKGQSKVG